MELPQLVHVDRQPAAEDRHDQAEPHGHLTGGDDPLRAAGSPSLRWASALFVAALFAELTIAILGTGLSVLGDEGHGFFSGFGTPAQIGRLFLTDFLLAFEVASLLLLIAAVGAVVLARRRTGLEDAREISVADLLRSPDRTGTVGEGERGTMLEAGGPPHR